jgi:hypothetical protein
MQGALRYEMAARHSALRFEQLNEDGENCLLLAQPLKRGRSVIPMRRTVK